MANQAFDPSGEWDLRDPDFHKEFSCGENGGTQSHREVLAPVGSDLPHETLIIVHEPSAVKDAIKTPEAVPTEKAITPKIRIPIVSMLRNSPAASLLPTPSPKKIVTVLIMEF